VRARVANRVAREAVIDVTRRLHQLPVVSEMGMLRQQSARHFSGESFFAWEVTISLRLADISQALLCGLASHDKSLTISLHRTDTNFLRPHYSEFLQLYPPAKCRTRSTTGTKH
jgi:hypothetical protein